MNIHTIQLLLAFLCLSTLLISSDNVYNDTLRNIKLIYVHNVFYTLKRKEIEQFLPPLKPEFCVKQAVRAILNSVRLHAAITIIQDNIWVM